MLDLIIPPGLRPQVQAALAGVAQHGQNIPNAELELMRKDGSRINVFSSHTVVRRPGHPPEIFCIDIDFTVRKAADETLQQGWSLLSIASRIGRLGAWRVDLPEDKPTWSEEVRSIHELPPDCVLSVEGQLFPSAFPWKLAPGRSVRRFTNCHSGKFALIGAGCIT